MVSPNVPKNPKNNDETNTRMQVLLIVIGVIFMLIGGIWIVASLFS